METLALLMTLSLTLPGVAAVVLICCGLYVGVRIIRMPPDRPGVKSVDEEEQPDGIGGIVAVILCVALLAFLIIVPARKGASPGGTLCAAGLALSGIGWGVRQIRLVRAQDKRDAEAVKEKNDHKGA